MQLGTFGLWISPRRIRGEDQAEAARLAEQLGFGALWLGGSPQLPAVRPLLAATRELVVATGIVNVWQYEPEQLAAEFAELEAGFPGRLLLGVGIGHPEATGEYARPLTKMASFLDGLDAAPAPVPADRRCVAALGPKMLALSAERSLGTHPYFVPVEHTRFARQQLGAGPLVAPELTCVIDRRPERAAATAREFARTYLELRNYASNLLRFGFDERDLADDGSDRLIDAVVPQGSAEEVAASARAHIGAGADHVCLQTVGVEGVPHEQWTELARALFG